MIDSSKWSVIEAGLKCVQGKADRELHQPEGGRGRLSAPRRALIRRYGAGVVVMAFDERGQAETVERKVEICQRAYHLLTEKVGLSPRTTSSSIPTSSPVATGIEEHARLTPSTSSRRRASSKPTCPGARISAACQQPVVLAFAATTRARGDALGVPLPRDPRRHGHGRSSTPGQLAVYEEIAPELLEHVEDVHLQSPRRRDRAAGRVRRAREGQGQEDGAGSRRGARRRSRSG